VEKVGRTRLTLSEEAESAKKGAVSECLMVKSRTSLPLARFRPFSVGYIMFSYKRGSL
jgi:hypothetical protein